MSFLLSICYDDMLTSILSAFLYISIIHMPTSIEEQRVLRWSVKGSNSPQSFLHVNGITSPLANCCNLHVFVICNHGIVPTPQRIFTTCFYSSKWGNMHANRSLFHCHCVNTTTCLRDVLLLFKRRKSAHKQIVFHQWLEACVLLLLSWCTNTHAKSI